MKVTSVVLSKQSSVVSVLRGVDQRGVCVGFVRPGEYARGPDWWRRASSTTSSAYDIDQAIIKCLTSKLPCIR